MEMVSNLSWGAFQTHSTCKVELSPKIVYDFQPRTIFAKKAILDVRLGSEYASAEHSHIQIYCKTQSVYTVDIV